MGKVIKYTGSQLLGAELRRLRGVRRQSDIAELSTRQPICRRVEPISGPTLSQIETGVSLPSLASLHTLAVIYRMPAQHFLNLLAQERLSAEANGTPTPEKAGDIERELAEAMAAGRWFEALSLALQGEREAETEKAAVAWRANRGALLHKCGMREGAISVLMDCSEHPLLSRQQQFPVLLNLVDALVSAGRPKMAGRILDTMPAQFGELSPAEQLQARLREANVALELLDPAADEGDPSTLRLARVIHALERVEEAPSCLDKASWFRLRIIRARGRHLLGNAAVARRDLESLLQEARATGFLLGEVAAGLGAGLVDRAEGRSQQARRLLEEAASLALTESFHDEAFTASFELYDMARRARSAEVDRYRKRLAKLLPLVDTRSRAVLSFERSEREQG